MSFKYTITAPYGHVSWPLSPQVYRAIALLFHFLYYLCGQNIGFSFDVAQLVRMFGYNKLMYNSCSNCQYCEENA